jgi:hypothetical protein
VLAKFRTRLTYANVVATLALFVALGGSSYAAVKITGKNVKDSSLTGKDIKNSSLTTSDVKNRSLLAKDFKSGQLPSGPKGDKGDTGAPATKLWAQIKQDGSLVHGSGVVASNATEAGRYNVTFDRDVSACAAVATAVFRDHSSGDGWGGIATVNDTDNPNQVRLLTATGTASTSPQAVDVAVFC